MDHPWLSILFLGVFGIYLVTMYPAYKLDDSPMTVASCVNLSSQHMPGYPAMTVLGKCFTFLPVGSVYFRVGIMAAVFSALTSCLVAVIVMKVYGYQLGFSSGFLAGVTLSLTKSMWGISTSGKGGIYSLNTFILAGLLFYALSKPTRRPSYVYAMVLCFAVGLSDHWMSVVVCGLPLFVLVGMRTVREWLLMFVILLLGLSLYLVLPLSHMREPMWEHTATWSGLEALVRRSDLTAGNIAVFSADNIRQFLWGLFQPLSGGSMMVMAIGVFGFLLMYKRNKKEMLCIAAAGLLVLVSVSLVNPPTMQGSGELILDFSTKYFPPWTLLYVIGSGVGINGIAILLRRKYGNACILILFLIPIQMLFTNFPEMNHTKDYLGPDYASNVLLSAGEGEILIGDDGEQMFPLTAEQIINNRNEELIILPGNVFKRKWGWQKLARLLTRVYVPRLLDSPTEENARKIIAMIEEKYVTSYLFISYYVKGRQDLLGRGLVLTPSKGVSMNYVEAEEKTRRAFRKYKQRGLMLPFERETSEVRCVLDQYVLARASPAVLARSSGNVPAAIEVYRRAVTYPGWIGLASAWRNLGLGYAIEGHHEEVEKAFRKAAVLRSRDATTWANLGIACLKQGEKQLAIKYLRRAISIDPHDVFARTKLAALLEESKI